MSNQDRFFTIGSHFQIPRGFERISISNSANSSHTRYAAQIMYGNHTKITIDATLLTTYGALDKDELPTIKEQKAFVHFTFGGLESEDQNLRQQIVNAFANTGYRCENTGTGFVIHANPELHKKDVIKQLEEILILFKQSLGQATAQEKEAPPTITTPPAGIISRVRQFFARNESPVFPIHLHDYPVGDSTYFQRHNITTDGDKKNGNITTTYTAKSPIIIGNTVTSLGATIYTELDNGKVAKQAAYMIFDPAPFGSQNVPLIEAVISKLKTALQEKGCTLVKEKKNIDVNKYHFHINFSKIPANPIAEFDNVYTLINQIIHQETAHLRQDQTPPSTPTTTATDLVLEDPEALTVRFPGSKNLTPFTQRAGLPDEIDKYIAIGLIAAKPECFPLQDPPVVITTERIQAFDGKINALAEKLWPTRNIIQDELRENFISTVGKIRESFLKEGTSVIRQNLLRFEESCRERFPDPNQIQK